MSSRKFMPKKPTGRAILLATNIVGGTARLQEILGLESPQQVSNWIYREATPPEYCLRIEYVTNGEVLAEQLNPECFDRSRARAAIFQ
jgi:DNA-binding transcriptional regulator YdaS (Cro superfamily)